MAQWYREGTWWISLPQRVIWALGQVVDGDGLCNRKEGKGKKQTLERIHSSSE